MALTTLAAVRLTPGLTNSATKTDAWLNSLIAFASTAIKKYCKQGLELANYVEYYNGNLETQLVLRQKPAWAGTTTVADASNGAVLPQATINVGSTLGFNPNGGVMAAQTGVSSFTPVSYTGTTSTSFTGCTGGTGTLNSAASYNAVGAPVVWTDANGRWGQNPQGFSAQALLAPGTNYALFVDATTEDGDTISNRALLQQIGGSNGLGLGFPPQPYCSTGKLAAYGQPVWSRGQGNIKVAYAAGFKTVPDDLQGVCNQLVANMVRFMPSGADLASESLGSYSYSILQRSLDVPALGSLSQTLAIYRDTCI